MAVVRQENKITSELRKMDERKSVSGAWLSPQQQEYLLKKELQTREMIRNSQAGSFLPVSEQKRNQFQALPTVPKSTEINNGEQKTSGLSLLESLAYGEVSKPQTERLQNGNTSQVKQDRLPNTGNLQQQQRVQTQRFPEIPAQYGGDSYLTTLHAMGPGNSNSGIIENRQNGYAYTEPLRQNGNGNRRTLYSYVQPEVSRIQYQQPSRSFPTEQFVPRATVQQRPIEQQSPRTVGNERQRKIVRNSIEILDGIKKLENSKVREVETLHTIGEKIKELQTISDSPLSLIPLPDLKKLSKFTENFENWYAQEDAKEKVNIQQRNTFGWLAPFIKQEVKMELDQKMQKQVSEIPTTPIAVQRDKQSYPQTGNGTYHISEHPTQKTESRKISYQQQQSRQEVPQNRDQNQAFVHLEDALHEVQQGNGFNVRNELERTRDQVTDLYAREKSKSSREKISLIEKVKTYAREKFKKRFS